MRDDKLLKRGEVAKMFGVNARTVTRWSDRGLLPFIQTPTGQRRYRYGDVKAAAAIHAPLDGLESQEIHSI